MCVCVCVCEAGGGSVRLRVLVLVGVHGERDLAVGLGDHISRQPFIHTHTNTGGRSVAVS